MRKFICVIFFHTHFIIIFLIKFKMKIPNKFKIDSLLSDTDFNLHPRYKEAIDNYGDFLDTNVYNFDYKVIDNEENFKEFFDTDYTQYKNCIENISKIFTKFEADYKTTDKKIFARRLDFSQIKNNTKLLNDLYDSTLPGIEKNVYNSNIKIIDLDSYQNTVCNSDKKISSWLWHFDNHPNEFIKMMIYLTDVDENSGPIEFIVDENNNGCKLKSDRIEKKDFFNRKKWDDPKYFKNQYNGNRIGEKDIEKLLKEGYKKKKILGKKGTIILFSENLIHRANHATKNHRNIINTVLSPSINKQNIYLNISYLKNKKGYEKWLD